MKALLAAGFGSNSVRLEDGPRVGQIRAAIYEQRTPWQRAAAVVSRALTDEGLMSHEYFEEAEAGASLIAVLAPEPQLVSEARQILAADGARYMSSTTTNALPTSRVMRAALLRMLAGR